MRLRRPHPTSLSRDAHPAHALGPWAGGIWAPERGAGADLKSEPWCPFAESQRAAVAVEQASFYPKGKPKENYKVENSTLNEIADAQGIGRNLVAWAKSVWDAAGTVNDMKKGPSAKPYQK